MKVNIDLEGVLQAAQDLPEELRSLDEVPAELRGYYAEADGRIVLDKAQRDGLVAELTEKVDRYRLGEENARLKDTEKRRMVVDTVRQQLASRGVKPGLMAGAVALFISQHKFGLKDGRVVVQGRAGVTDAEAAAVSWIADEGEAYTDSAPAAATGGFAAEVAKLKNLH